MEQVTYVLLHVFLAMLEGSLSKLRGDLGRGIAHKLPVCAKGIAHVAPLLLLIGIPPVAHLMRLRGARRRRR